jgi:hypothetical protein
VAADWLSQLLVFSIDVPADNSAKERLEKWASSQSGFTPWIFASCTFAAAGDMENAEACVLRAIAFRPDDPDWVRTHARYRGAPMCLRLYESGRYATCVKLCDALLHYTGAGNHVAPEIQAIRSAASQVISGTPAITPAPAIQDRFDPFQGIMLTELAALQAAPATTASHSRIVSIHGSDDRTRIRPTRGRS